MREILFRGQTRRKGEKVWMDGSPVDSNWVYGGIFQGKNHSVIYGYDPIEKNVVYSDTVGQFAGFADKNGVRIFEGDIFQIDEDDIAIVVFKNGCFRLEVHGICGAWTESGFDESGGGLGILDCDPIDWYFISDMEVIGNIHDNPELLGGKDGN